MKHKTDPGTPPGVMKLKFPTPVTDEDPYIPVLPKLSRLSLLSRPASNIAAASPEYPGAEAEGFFGPTPRTPELRYSSKNNWCLMVMKAIAAETLDELK